MKSTTSFIVSLALLTLCACASKDRGVTNSESPASASNPLVPTTFGPNYKYNELLTKDYDEMLAMVQDMIKKSHAAANKPDQGGEGAAVEWLGRALKLTFSRPDSDNMIAKLVGEVRRDLQGYSSYEDVIAALANEAIAIFKNSNSTILSQSTALVEIENIMGEIRPEVRNGNVGLQRVVESVRDAHLKISDEVKKDRRLRGMFLTKNPSDEARDLLKLVEKKKRK